MSRASVSSLCSASNSLHLAGRLRFAGPLPYNPPGWAAHAVADRWPEERRVNSPG